MGQRQALGCESPAHHRQVNGHRVREPRTTSGCVRALGAGDSDSIGKWQALGCGTLAHHRASGKPLGADASTTIGSMRNLGCGSLAQHRRGNEPRVRYPRTPSGGGRPLGADASPTIGTMRTLECGRLAQHQFYEFSPGFGSGGFLGHCLFHLIGGLPPPVASLRSWLLWATILDGAWFWFPWYRWRAARVCHGDWGLNPPLFAERLSVRFHASWIRGLTRILSDPPQSPNRTPTIWCQACLFSPFGSFDPSWHYLVSRPWSAYLIRVVAVGDLAWLIWVVFLSRLGFGIEPVWHALGSPFSHWAFHDTLWTTPNVWTLDRGFLGVLFVHDQRWGRRAVSYLNLNLCFFLASFAIFVSSSSLPAFYLLYLQQMDSEILSSMENLHFTEEEFESVIIEPPATEEEDSSLWLVGSVITKLPVKGEEVYRIFRSVWKPKNVSEITELCPNFFLIKPVSVDAQTMILNRRPWVLDDDLFSIVSYNPAWRLADFDFSRMLIWVRVFQLPLRAMNSAMGLRLGSRIGRAIAIDHRVEGGNLGEFLRIRVEVDISKPLRRFVLLGNGQGKKPSPCPLCYERLPNFCFFCGLVGHLLASCMTKPVELDTAKLQYGAWLRVSTQQPRSGPRKRQGIEFFSPSSTQQASDPSPTAPAPSSSVAASFTDQAHADTPAGLSSNLNAAATSSPVPDHISSTAHLNTAGTVDKAQQNANGACTQPVAPALPDPSPVNNVVAREGHEHLLAAVSLAAGTLEKAEGSSLIAGTVGSVAEGNAVVLPSSQVAAGTLKKAEGSSLVAGTIVSNSGGKSMVLPSSKAAKEHGLSLPMPAVEVKHTEGSKDADSGLVLSIPAAASNPVRAKRSLQGKYELCTPFHQKRTRLHTSGPPTNSDADHKHTGMSSLHSSTKVAETRLKQSSTSRIQHALNMDGCFVVDYGNGCTGLMILWNRKINVSLLSYSPIHIDVNVASDSGSFHFSGLHGHCVDKNKHLTWSTIDRLRSSSALPWLVGGDINEILCHSEKEGGRRKLPGFLDTFRDCLDRNHLIDCKPISGWFTWLYTNSVSGSVIQERLDRYLATTDWSLFRLRVGLVTTSVLIVVGRRRRLDSRKSVLLGCTPQGTITDAAKTAFLEAKREHKSLLDKDEAYWAQRLECLGSLKATATLRTFMLGPWADARRTVSGDSLMRAAYGQISRLRQHWELIGPDILRLCHDLLAHKIDMSCITATVITLIPKVEDPVRMQQLRPISLCTVVYKIVSKTILNRMKPFLPRCISENQSTFLKGRLISDNILVAHELLHYLCSSKNGPNKGAALKLDMEKTFDRVEWTFLQSVLLRMGFHSDWVDLLMDCVSTVTFRIRINGRLSPVIIPQRGLRQGDPLSPFLFVICMQGLSATLLAEQAAGRIMGIWASQKGPRVNHLLYTDDSIVFTRNSEREASRLKEVLRLFADSSGQRINFGKSTVFYSPSTPSADRDRISAILGIVEVFDRGIYLGVPLRVGKNKTNVFGFLNKKVDDRVSGWTKRLLSFGGRYWWSGKLSERGWPL
ncbi:hypothetical protein GQ457_12G013550 [Hibiscus cannabinus]